MLLAGLIESDVKVVEILVEKGDVNCETSDGVRLVLLVKGNIVLVGGV